MVGVVGPVRTSGGCWETSVRASGGWWETSVRASGGWWETSVRASGGCWETSVRASGGCDQKCTVADMSCTYSFVHTVHLSVSGTTHCSIEEHPPLPSPPLPSPVPLCIMCAADIQGDTDAGEVVH